jgi:sulfite dehydrogenase (quinone) subunit SoeC
MNPAFSLVFLTTLIGAAQGLFIALWAAELAGFGFDAQERGFFVLGGGVALVLSALGLVASFFHLGRPERAWRTAAMWRTSWLSREVIALPLFMLLMLVWTLMHFNGRSGTVGLGLLAALTCATLFVCTAMIYQSVRFLQEWASAYTLVNYTLLGLASGFTLAAALASHGPAFNAVPLTPAFAMGAIFFTLAAWASRSLSLPRNARLKPKSTVQTALGIRHPKVVQRSMGFMGGSFNTREFFHGRTPGALRRVLWAFVAGAFVLPLVLLWGGLVSGGPAFFGFAFVVQYLGLLAERWFFFAQANHPQNLYYQAVS